MKLDLDCIRDILLELEKCSYGESVLPSDLENQLPQYHKDDIQYNCLKLYEAGYIDAVCIRMDNLRLPYIKYIIDITYPGHEFLANIRTPKNWEKVKEVGGKVGAFGLNMAGKIAESIATAYFKQVIGLS